MPIGAQDLLREQQEQRVSIVLDLPADSTGTRELPFQLGIVGDFTGDQRAHLNPLASREFVDLDHSSLPRTVAEVEERKRRRTPVELGVPSDQDIDAERLTLFEVARPNLKLDDIKYEIQEEVMSLLRDFGFPVPIETSNASILPVSLDFSCMESFSPKQIIKQVKPLDQLLQLLEMLESLKDLMLENPELEPLISNWAKNSNN